MATRTTKGRRRRVHPIVAASTLLPLGVGLLAPSTTPKPAVTGAPAVVSEITAACTLPFDTIKMHHPIDDSCTADGNAGPGTPQAQQNEAKNNYCSTTPPVDIDFDVLRQLQQDASKPGSGITFGSDAQLPRDRSVLRHLPTKAGALGEGDVVRIVAFVINAHGSNLTGGESVNCKQSGAENNDIHIVLGQNGPNDDECTSVTAEMSPHFRPAVWTPDALNQHNAHLYRFTGQLFFDASHRPCSGSTGSPPKRSSLWEIHPVYAVDICADSHNQCKVDSEENWISFAVFAQQQGENPSETLLQLPGELADGFGAGSAGRACSR